MAIIVDFWYKLNVMNDRVKRTLCAVMFTDIVGYSDLMHHDEAIAIKMVRVFKSVLEKNVKRYGGFIVQYYGDGSLCTFDSAVEAARCAIHFQQDLSIEQLSIPVRLGLHLGDIVQDNSGSYGDGVNIASRIESMGIAFSVLMSKSMQMELKNHPEINLHSLGDFEFKNIEEPLEVFAVEADKLVVPIKNELIGKFKLNNNKANDRHKFLSNKRIAGLMFIIGILSIPLFINDLWRTTNYQNSLFKTSIASVFVFLLIALCFNVKRQKTNVTHSFKAHFYSPILAVFLAVVLMSNVIAPEVVNLSILNKIRNDKIAVMIFENKSEQLEYDEIGSMISDRITQGLSNMGSTKVVSYRSVLDNEPNIHRAGLTGEQFVTFSRVTGARHVLDGNYYVIGDKLYIQAHIIDAKNGEFLYSFPAIESDLEGNSIIEAIEKLRLNIMGFWTTKNIPTFDNDPPRYDAYVEYLKGRNIWQSDWNKTESHLLKSLELDSTFWDSHLHLITVYIQLSDQIKMNKHLNILTEHRDLLNPFQQRFLELYEADLSGDLLKSYYTYQSIYDFDPEDVFINTSFASANLKMLNNPDEALDVLFKIEESSLDLISEKYVKERIIVMIRANLSAGHIENGLILLDKYATQINTRLIWSLYIWAYILDDNWDELENLVEVLQLKTLSDGKAPKYFYFDAARKLIMNSESLQAQSYIDRGIEAYKSGSTLTDNKYLSRLYHLNEDWQSVILVTSEIIKGDSNQELAKQLHAMAESRLGDFSEADSLIEELIDKAKDQADYGRSYYYIAGLYMAMNKKTKAIYYLNQAWNSGYIFTLYRYQHDPVFKDLIHKKEFDSVVNKI